MFATLRGAAQHTLPKRLDAQTLHRVRSALAPGSGRSATEVSQQTGISRVTARRYLEYLVTAERAVRTPRYGNPGRPEVEYRPV